MVTSYKYYEYKQDEMIEDLKKDIDKLINDYLKIAKNIDYTD
jgi:hypothetical protein|tara:strand:- start:52 stop:177 length:126 start_codon:yes stop_codon:yes gene_type:complete